MIDFYLRRCARSGMKSRLLVFNYHNILPTNAIAGLLGTSNADFSRQVDWLHKHFQLLPLQDAMEKCRRGLITQPTATITLDDGYETQYTLGAQILKAAGVPATFFVNSGHLAHNIMWNDWFRLFAIQADKNQWRTLGEILEIPLEFSERVPSYRELKDIETNIKYRTLECREPIINFLKHTAPANSEVLRMMDEESIRQLATDGFEVGAHSLSHPILELELEVDAERQISEDIKNLTGILGQSVTSFAIPNGKPVIDYSDRHIKMLARNGVRYVMTSSFGHFSPGKDPMQVARVCLTGSSEFDYLRTCRQAYNAPLDIVPSRGYENRTRIHSV